MDARIIVAGYIMYYTNPFVLLLLVLNCFKLQFFTIHFDDRSAISRFEKRMKDSKTWNLLCWKNINGREYPQGFYISTAFIVHMEGTATENILAKIIATEAVYATLMAPPEQTEPCSEVKKTDAVSSTIVVYIQKGGFKNLYYNRVRLQVDHLKPLPSQRIIIDGILKVYQKLERATIFLHGVTGAGKSSVGYLVAKELCGKYCHSFNPCEPGNQLCALLCDSDTDASSPLVVVLEEVDGIIRRLAEGEVSLNNEVPTQVYNKSTWASFLDDMFLFKNVVLILTSNRSKEELDAIDPAYLRCGRVHESFCMNETLVF